MITFEQFWYGLQGFAAGVGIGVILSFVVWAIQDDI